MFPGIFRLRKIVEWAYTHGQMPSAVWEQYLNNPRDFHLLWSYEIWLVAEQEKSKGG